MSSPSACWRCRTEMSLALTEEQEFIARTAADFVAQKSPLSRLRALRDSGDELGWSRALYKEMAELGWLGIATPEELGGAGMGFAELALIMEELGRSLAPEPLLSCVLMGGQALQLAAQGGGAADRKRAAEWLPKICEGNAIIALAHQEEGNRYELDECDTSFRVESGGQFVLEGKKIQVLDGHKPDAFIVSAENEEGDLSLFWMPADSGNFSTQRQFRVDCRSAAILELNGVRLPPQAMLGKPDLGGELLEQVILRATTGLCAEMLGGMQQAFHLTLEHLRSREQFGVLIGSFQALKHRAANIFIEIELARSAVRAAAHALDTLSGEDPELAKLVSLAKARCSEGYLLAANEGVQMFGGVGMTDEYDIGLYLKRARAAELSFGDAAHHRERWAELSGY